MTSFFPGPGPHLAEDRTSLLSVKSVTPSPDTLTKLVKRLRALTLKLLPVEVSPEALDDPTGRVITPEVVAAFRAAAGDFGEALPYCLLRARAEFMWDANHNAADYAENLGRAVACEVLARRILHQSPGDRITAIMSTRFKHRQVDGDESEMSSALEMAIDSHCTIFLSSSEAQDVVEQLWKGELIQQNNENHDIDYVPYSEVHTHTFWGHLDPSRLSVPRYQNFFRIAVWLFFLVVYSQAVRQPVQRLDPSNNWSFDEWEIVLYVLGLAISLEDTHKIYKLLRFVTWRAFTFWNVISAVTDSLLVAAFVLRLIGVESSGQRAMTLRITSFQVLSFVAPFIWMKLVTVFDGYKYIGTMQICVARMLQESGIFFALLGILAIGFAQAMYALDAADGTTDPPSSVVRSLVEALLQAPDFERFAGSPAGLTLFYFWNVVTAIILLNVLISLFSSAYSDVVDDSEAQYLAFFAGKTVGMIRAPDSYVYPAPFNLIEILLISPFEFLPFFRLTDVQYAKLNRIVMRFVFFIPLAMIALFESTVGNDQKQIWMKNWLRGNDEGAEDYPESRDPEVDDDEDGLKISKVPFSELVKVFPNTAQSSEALMLHEIRGLRGEVEKLMRRLDESDLKRDE